MHIAPEAIFRQLPGTGCTNLCRTFPRPCAISHAAMKSVRFSKVVAKSGRPETLLLLTDPKKDPALQKAVKANRVMTVMQSSAKTKTDWGEPGFHPGPQRQYLLFPRSLSSFTNKAVIGIKYDLLSDAQAPKPKPSAKKAPFKKPPAKPPLPKEKETETPSDTAADTKAPPKTETKKEVKAETKAKKKPPAKAQDTSEITTLKRSVKRAMQALEKGKQVLAFNLLQKIIDT
jgi:hypothetical protein